MRLGEEDKSALPLEASHAPDPSPGLDTPYEVTVEPEQFTDGSWGYMARVTELPGCECHADTPDEARADLEQVKALFLETMVENGLTPPEASQTQ